MLLLLATVEPPSLSAGSPATSPAGRPPAALLTDARDLALDGRYDEAAAVFERLAAGADRSQALAAACARAEIDLLVGDYADGIARLEKFETEGAASAAWHAALAALLERVGRCDKAVAHNQSALRRDVDCFRARWQLGRLHELGGRRDEAIKTYEPFETLMTAGSLPETAEALTWVGRGFLRISALKRHPELARRTKHVLTEVYQEAFDFLDARYWPARLAAAELLLEKHNLPDAEADFKHILQQNARVPAAHVGLGAIALENWNFEQAEQHADAALAINPNCAEAFVLLARTRMTERRYASAAEAAGKALAVNENDLDALGLLAAAQLRRDDRAGYEATCARARKINARPAVLHHAVGAWLSAGRQFAEAETHLKQAVDTDPTWSEPRTELGLLYMEIGEETQARAALEASFAMDGFNQRTYNVLNLLDELERFARLKSERFVLKYDAAEDGVVAPYFLETLEGLHDEVCNRFDVKLERSTIVELFPTHAQFSVRVLGRPFIATVGACTGRVIALTAPRGRAPFGRYNWASTLRHEFTHTVTLAATENRIPHWFTEGLAVHEEPAPRSWTWKQMLADAVRRGRLFTLRSIDWGFMRPRHPNDRQLAYAQSEWMVEYLIEKHGEPSIHKLLTAFKNRKTQKQAFRDVLGTATTKFDAAFAAWARKQAEDWGLPLDPLESVERLRSRLERKPDDAALLGRLAEALLLDGEYEDAEETALKALKSNADERRALEVLSHILVGKALAEKEDPARLAAMKTAEPFIRRLCRLDPNVPAAMKYRGYLEQAAEQWSEAIEWLSRYQRRCPEDPDSYRRIAAIHLLRKQPAKALPLLERVFELTEDEPAVAKQVAAIYRERRDPAAAAAWLRKAVEVDPYDLETHLGLGDSLLACDRPADAQREFAVATKIAPLDAAGFHGLARSFDALGDRAQAKEHRERAKALGGDRPNAGQ